MNKLRGKEIQLVMTAAFKAMYGDRYDLVRAALEELGDRPDVDMLVFETETDGLHIRFEKPNGEQVDLPYPAVEPIKKAWFKVDDYGDKYVGTFLFPHEY